MNKQLKFLFLAVGAIVIYGGGQIVRRELLNLKYFKASEFGIWWPLMSVDLLVKLDAFREEWGAPVMITPVEGGIGREIDKGDRGHGSMHNFSLFGEVRAIDVFPRGMDSLGERRRAYTIAKKVGFTGIGVYTDTRPSNMLHLDNREKPLYWTRINKVYNYGVIS